MVSSAPTWQSNAFGLQRLAAALGRAVQLHLHKIVVLDGAALNGG